MKPLRNLSPMELNSITQVAHGTVSAFAKLSGHKIESWNVLDANHQEEIRSCVWAMTQNIVENINNKTENGNSAIKVPFYGFLEWCTLFQDTIIALTQACLPEYDYPKITNPYKLVNGRTGIIHSSIK